MSVVSPDDARGSRRRPLARATMARVGATAGAAACALLGACTTPVPLPPAPILSQPVTGEVEQLNPYKLQVGDQLDIKFPLNPELNEQVTVTPDGTISTAFMSDVPAYGGTIADLAAKLRQGYKADLSNPRVSVILRSFAPNRVYVAGEVNSPGEFITVGPNLTVSQAIARAGGIKFSADRDKVFVIRRGTDDKPEAFAIDYQGIITAKDPAADIRLAQYDVIYVPRTGIGDTYQVVQQYILEFLPFSASLNASIGSAFIK
jgi:polysaccharide export outer membrane protein